MSLHPGYHRDAFNLYAMQLQYNIYHEQVYKNNLHEAKN